MMVPNSKEQGSAITLRVDEPAVRRTDVPPERMFGAKTKNGFVGLLYLPLRCFAPEPFTKNMN